MPELSRFYGIIIAMFFDDHNPPHFHVHYGSFNAVIIINDFRIVEGKLPPKALGLVMEWTSIHQNELLNAWEMAKNNQTPNKIDPLE
jgi:hypothetical protein